MLGMQEGAQNRQMHHVAARLTASHDTDAARCGIKELQFRARSSSDSFWRKFWPPSPFSDGKPSLQLLQAVCFTRRRSTIGFIERQKPSTNCSSAVWKKGKGKLEEVNRKRFKDSSPFAWFLRS